MTLFLMALGCLFAAAAASLAGPGRVFAGRLALAGIFSGCALGLVAALQALAGGAVSAYELPWSLPGGRLSVGMDALTAWFLLPVFGLGGLSAIHGAASGTSGRGRGHWAAYALLLAGMAIALTARNAVLFLAAWEGMALASFVLVAEDSKRPGVQEASWIYLVASQLGAACLILFFVLASSAAGDFSFAEIGSYVSDGRAFSGRTAYLLLALAFVGFGTKAGLVPFHVWLPEAHPAAPSHVSALMSGAMIKTGLYGLVRLATWLPASGPGAELFENLGWTLLVVGIVSGVVGVLFALAQHDLKRLLAYSSVENIGIIALAIGLALIARAHGAPGLAAVAMAGGLLHVAYHAAFKGLLFLGAGSLIQATDEHEMDRMGGLLRRMPWTAGTFVIGAAAICAIPPFSGFASEFLAYLSALSAGTGSDQLLAFAGIAAVGSLALMGALAVATFVKVVGIALLGQPRTKASAEAVEMAPMGRVAPVALALVCAAGGIALPWLLPALTAPVRALIPAADLAGTAASARGASLVCAGLVALAAMWLALRWLLLRNRERAVSLTWDCGFDEPAPRMQYTASSFAQPLLAVFARIVPVHSRYEEPSGYFPDQGKFTSHTPAMFSERLYRPAFAWAESLLGRLRILQHGQLHWYVLYVAAILAILLVWKLPG